jgi:hypothetical protein
MRTIAALLTLLASALPLPLAAAPSPGSFAELCASKALTKDQEYTLRIVLQDLIDRESEFLPERTPEICKQAESELLFRTGLFLVNKDLVDVSPLATLSKIEFLYLSHNRIEDVAPLASLHELTVLDLEDNKVRDATPLGKLSKLHELVLKDNPIEHDVARPAPPVQTAKAAAVDVQEAPPREYVTVRHESYDYGGYYVYSSPVWYHHHHYYGRHHHHHHHDDWFWPWFGVGVGLGIGAASW